MIDFIGKSLVIEEENEKVLVISDLHLGYDANLRAGGVLVSGSLFKETLEEINTVLNKVGRVKYLILLGDVKHVFGRILHEEWNETVRLFDLLRTYCKEIIVIKGNHDTILDPILKKENIKLLNNFVWKSYVFLHGDKDFDSIYDKKIKCWVVGHAHPALVLNDGIKKEKYKCFLKGLYKGKEIIVMPSFFRVYEGSDVLNDDLGLAWSFNLKSFNVYVVESELNVLNFGKLSKIKGINLLF